MRRMLLFVALGTVLSGAWPSAFAQSIDYGAFEQLFGEPVTTSATGSPQRVSEAPVTMEIIGADEIRRSGARDIPGVLRHVSGIDVLQWTNDNADVSVRGYNQAASSRLLVLIDGRQVYADYFGFTPWSALPVELNQIRQIEVVKGSSSALFGFNAVGGVINIVTYNPLYDDVNKVAITGGTQDTIEGSAVGTFKLGENAAFQLTGGMRANKDFSTPLVPAMGATARRAHDRGEVSMKGVFRLTDKIELSIDGSHSETDQNQVNPIYAFDFEKLETNSVRGQILADTSFGLVQGSIYSNWITNETIIPAIGALHFSNQVTVARLEDIIKIGSNHTVRGMAEYRHNTETTTPFAGGAVFYDVASVGGMWDWHMTPSISLTNAVRLDKLMLGRTGAVPADYPFTNADWNISHTEISFNSGLVWKVDDLNTLRLTASRGVQVANLNFAGAVVISNPFISFTGFPTLQPTTVNNYEMGWDRDLPSLNARMRLVLFFQDNDDPVALGGGFISGPAGPYFGPSNAGESHGKGGTVDIKGRFLEDWRWGFNLRYQSIQEDFTPAVSGSRAFLDYKHTTPLFLGNASLGWSHGPWEIDAFVRYQSRSYGLLPLIPGAVSTLTRIPGYASVDGRIGYKWSDQVTLAVAAQNFAQATQRQTSGPAIERRVLGTISFNF